MTRRRSPPRTIFIPGQMFLFRNRAYNPKLTSWKPQPCFDHTRLCPPRQHSILSCGSLSLNLNTPQNGPKYVRHLESPAHRVISCGPSMQSGCRKQAHRPFTRKSWPQPRAMVGHLQRGVKSKFGRSEGPPSSKEVTGQAML